MRVLTRAIARCVAENSRLALASLRRLADQKRAGEHGLSVEEEHRRILREVLIPEGGNLTFWEHLSNFPDVGDDSIFERDRSLPDRASNQRLFEDE